MNEDVLKRKLRSLKKRELRIRNGRKSVWEMYFGKKNPKYCMSLLSAMDEVTCEIVWDEYDAQMIYTYLDETGFSAINNLNPELLYILGLPNDASLTQVKSRFRQLAHRYHPDHGGDASAFMKIHKAYSELKD